ncbi:MAG: ABC-F family ATP-binding cassette domain-containing protein [Candidatus Eisenbacteria bacterium]|uniref:ABC-F family ATP-binding cassette domain-containing protein n=1 Tax=Eiseniibacteriota bacterium TaxID=2212470 RepID=A0A849SH39_UNCEI|nr:ABC-F family ATP-binding cassette domain-containing protein [Candidatus Eisenbacteria bacterium]
MIAFQNVSKQYGRQILFVETSFQLNPGEKAGLVGPNGAGKTTVFRMIVGEEIPDEGEVSTPKRTSVGYYRQDIGEMSGRWVLDETIASSGSLGDLHHELKALEAAMADPERAGDMDRILERYGHAQEEYERGGGYDLESRAREVLHGLGFDDPQVDGDVGALSGGWKMRVGLARILLGRPDVLLMDEPTNHLDIESILWLEAFIRDYPGAVLMTCHDKDFMNRIVSRVIEIDGGEFTSYTGDYDFYVRQRTIATANREAAHARQQAMLAKERRFIERFAAHAAKAAQVQSRVKKLEKIEMVELPRQRKIVEFRFKSPPPRSGEEVLEIKGVRKAYGERVIYDGFDFSIRRTERWCVMGRNGAGKTTLLKLVAGTIAPDAGSVKLGASLKVGYFAQQSLELLDPELSVFEQIQRDFPLENQGTMRNLLGAFQFSGGDVDKPIRVLSGGEKSRLVLARMLFDPPNFLVLDEPTNHLDLETKEMLVASLENFEGTMLFVSHDRTFLRGLSNRVLELRPGDGAGEAAQPPFAYGGSYNEFVERTGSEAAGVHR